MPSKHSEQLKEAIDLIRAGNKDAAREMILEIIQDEPQYEKAWLWLVETVANRADKVEILRTRLEQYPDDSPYSRIALEKIAPEVLDNLIPVSEAIIYPADLEPISAPSEDEIQFDVTVDQHDQGAFRPDEEDLIQFEENNDSSPFTEGELNFSDFELAEGEIDPFSDDLTEGIADTENEVFSLFDDEEGEELQKEDLALFIGNEETSPFSADAQIGEEVDFDSWLVDNDDETAPIDSANALADFLEEAPLTEEEDLDDSIFGIQEEAAEDTGTSSPFVLDDDSKQILGVTAGDGAAMEPGSIDDLFRDIELDDLSPTPGLFDDDSVGSAESEASFISPEDITAASASFEHDSIPPEPEPEKPDKKKGKEKKEKGKNSTFIIGCSVIGGILLIATLAFGYLIWKQAQNPKPEPISSPTITATATVTHTPTAPAVAPWLQKTEDPQDPAQPTEESSAFTATPLPETTQEAESTPEPEPTDELDTVLTPGDVGADPGLSGRTLQEWITFFEQYDYECILLEGSGDALYQMCEYLDDDHDVIAVLYGTQEIMPTRIEFQVLAMEADVLAPSQALDTLLIETLAPIVIAPIAAEFQEEAQEWFLTEATRLVAEGIRQEVEEMFGEQTITIEFMDFLRIEL